MRKNITTAFLVASLTVGCSNPETLQTPKVVERPKIEELPSPVEKPTTCNEARLRAALRVLSGDEKPDPFANELLAILTPRTPRTDRLSPNSTIQAASKSGKKFIPNFALLCEDNGILVAEVAQDNRLVLASEFDAVEDVADVVYHSINDSSIIETGDIVKALEIIPIFFAGDQGSETTIAPPSTLNI